MNTTIKAFHCPISEIRDNDVRSGILIYPLPDADQILRDRIYLALAKLYIQIHDFIITDPTSIEPWCKSVGIQPINTPSLLGIWIYKDDAQKYVNLIQKIVCEYQS